MVLVYGTIISTPLPNYNWRNWHKRYVNFSMNLTTLILKGPLIKMVGPQEKRDKQRPVFASQVFCTPSTTHKGYRGGQGFLFKANIGDKIFLSKLISQRKYAEKAIFSNCQNRRHIKALDVTSTLSIMSIFLLAQTSLRFCSDFWETPKISSCTVR